MTEINWDEAIPSDGSTVRATEVRKLWSDVKTGLETSLEWDGRVNGELKVGASRAFVRAGGSQFSGTYESASSSREQLIIGSTSSQAFVMNNATANKFQFLGGYNMLEYVDDPTPPGVWHHTSGRSKLVAPDGTVSLVTFAAQGVGAAEVTYSVPPQVFVTSANTDYRPWVRKITTETFQVGMEPLQGAASDVTIYWSSSGTSTV